MKSRRVVAAVAVVAAVGACGVPAESTIEDDDAAVRVGWTQPFWSQNNLTTTGNAATNTNVLYLTTAQFNHYDSDLDLVPNEDFGSYEVVSEDPFTVSYTINEGVTWSDGVPVDAVDVFLHWAAGNDSFDTASPGDVETDWDSGMTDAGEAVYFSSSSPALNLIEEVPEISDDGRTITFVYSEPRSDWEVAIQPSPVAAHAVAGLALGIEDPQEAKQAVVDAFTDRDVEALAPLSETWNNAFTFTSLPDDERLYLSSGAYVLTDLVEDEYLTVTARDDYTWGPEPATETITLRFNRDPLAAAAALENGEVDLIAPPTSVDLVATLEGMDGVTHESTSDSTFEHVDLVFDNGGPFDPASHGGDEEVARMVRRAFLLSVPRSEIMEKLVAPVQPDAEVRNSHNLVPGAAGYDEVVAGNGSDLFGPDDEANREAAAALLDQAGVQTPVDVRLLYGAGIPSRERQFDLISASAAEVGFRVVDEGDTDWGVRVDDPSTYDASLYGWQSTSTFAVNGQAMYSSDGVANVSGYRDPELDAWWDELATTTDPEREVELLVLIERRLFEVGLSLPIFQHPGVVAWRDELQGVSSIPLVPTVFWNYWDWEIDPEARPDPR